LHSGYFAHVHIILSTERYQFQMFTIAVTLWGVIINIIMVCYYVILQIYYYNVYFEYVCVKYIGQTRKAVPVEIICQLRIPTI
jgi:hypothetical protein